MSVNTLTKVTYTPPYESAEPYTVYAVNCKNPEKSHLGWSQGYYHCTNCGEGNQFRFYDESPYLCKCPTCNTDFLVVDDTDYDD